MGMPSIHALRRVLCLARLLVVSILSPMAMDRYPETARPGVPQLQPNSDSSSHGLALPFGLRRRGTALANWRKR
jgi:hypothetical protein